MLALSGGLFTGVRWSESSCINVFWGVGFGANVGLQSSWDISTREDGPVILIVPETAMGFVLMGQELFWTKLLKGPVGGIDLTDHGN